MSFDENKYKALFESRFGAGSFNAGLNQARDIGRSSAQAEYAKALYEKRKEEAKKVTYEDAYKFWSDPTNKAQAKKQGAAKTAEDIRNDPRRQEQIKSAGYDINQFIDAMYEAASDGKFRSEREFTKYGEKLQKEVDEQSIYQKHGVANETTGDVNKLKNLPKKNNDRSGLEKFTDFFKNKDVDGDGERDGLLGVMDRFVAPISKGATEFIAPGNAKQMTKNSPDNPVVKAANKDRGVETKILNAAGTIVGATAPVGQSYKVANTVLNKIPKLAQLSNPYAKRAVTGAVAGGIAEGGVSGINEVVNPDAFNAKDHAVRTGIGVAAGGILDPAFYGAGKAIASILKRGKTVPTPDEVIPKPDIEPKEELLTLPAPQLRLPEPQLRLPGPQKVNEPIESIFKKPNLLDNPIPSIPDGLKKIMTKQRLAEMKAELGFGYNTKNTPKARKDFSPYEPPVDPYNRGQEYWLKRYEEFAEEVNSRHDLNNLTPEALEDLWSSYAKYDEPLKLDQVVDLAYPKGYEPPPSVPKVEEPSPTPRTIKDDLREDPRINELIKALHPPKAETPPVSRKATLEEMVERLKQLAPPKKLDTDLEPLQFRRSAGGGLDSSFNPTSTLEQRLKQVFGNANETASINRIKKENLQSGRDFEAIESLKGNGGKLTRTSDTLLDTERQAQGNADSFRTKVDRTPKKTNSLKDFASKMRTQFIDDLAPLEKLEKSIRGTVSSAEDSLYKQGRLFRGTSEKANQVVETQLKPILNNVEKAGYSINDLGDYALAVHARDVNAKGINSGFTNTEIKGVIDKFGNPTMENARKELLKLNNSLLNTLADSGVISKEMVQQLQKKHPNYMPLFRSFDDEKIEYASGMSNALSVGSSPLQKLEGSSRDVIDPIESIVKNIFRLTNTADRNVVARQLGTLAKEDVDGTFVRQLNAGEDVGRKNVISAMENGSKVQYEVPPDVYKAMKNMDQESTNFLIKILQKPASTLRAGATLTPEFSLRNPMRDVAQAYVVSNSGFNPLVDFPVGLFQAAMKGRPIKIAGKEIKTPDKLYRQFIQDNGGLGNIVSVDRDMHRKAIEDALKSNDKKFVNVVNPKAWLDVLRSIADVSETATKLGEYRAALRSGATRQEAAYRARDIMDFARAGVSVREANKVVAFLNANIQGKSKLIRAIQENPTKVAMNSMKAVTLPTVGVFLAQRYLATDEQKRLIDDAPDWLRNSFWLVPVPGTEQVARIPKPFDIAPIFANIPERALDYFAKNDPEAFDNFARETFSSYTIPTMLTGIAPIIEGMANYSFFREGPIIPQRERNLNYPDQYDINTSETAKVLGKGINALTSGKGAFKNFGSPRVVDNTIRGLTGGLGAYVTDAVDLIVEGTGIVDEVDKPEKDFLTEQTPLRAFLMNKNSTGVSVDKLYTLKDKLNRDRGSSKLTQDGYAQEGLYKAVNDVTKDVSEISKVIRQIENDRNMSSEQKRTEIDRLNKLRNEIAFKRLKDLQQYIK